MSFAHQVVDFNQQVLGIAQRPIGMLGDAEFEISKKCLEEETLEFVEAHQAGDIIKAVDGIVDLMYFAVGVLYKMGLTPDQIVEIQTAVHEANMEKKLGVVAKRGDGSAADAVKPEGWIPPEGRIEAILDAA
jgi:predicted HAD superfamily Cof-like phosphohydrolase